MGNVRGLKANFYYISVLGQERGTWCLHGMLWCGRVSQIVVQIDCSWQQLWSNYALHSSIIVTDKCSFPPSFTIKFKIWNHCKVVQTCGEEARRGSGGYCVCAVVVASCEGDFRGKKTILRSTMLTLHRYHPGETTGEREAHSL